MSAWTSPGPAARREAVEDRGGRRRRRGGRRSRAGRSVSAHAAHCNCTMPVVEISGYRRSGQPLGGSGRGRSRPPGRSTTRRARGRRRRARPRPLAAELGRDLGPHLLAGGELDDRGRARGPSRSGRRRTRSHISIHSSSAFHRATWANASSVEVGAELAVEHVQDVAVELGGDAGRVVVGGDEPVGVLHEVGAEQERVAGLEPGGERRRGTRRASPAAGCRSCRRGTRRAGGRRRAAGRGGARSRRRPRARRCPGAPPRSRRPRRAASSRSRRTGRSGGACPARASASSSSRVFSDVPDPSSTSVSAPLAAAISSARASRIARSARVG